MTSLRISPRTMREPMPIGISVGLLLGVIWLACDCIGARSHHFCEGYHVC